MNKRIEEFELKLWNKIYHEVESMFGDEKFYIPSMAKLVAEKVDMNDYLTQQFKEIREEERETQKVIIGDGIAAALKQQREEIVGMLKSVKPGYTAWFRRYNELPGTVQEDPKNMLEPFLENYYDMGATRYLDQAIQKIKEMK